jgi:hypothetical protein
MTAKEFLELNGDLHSSPLFDAVRRFHALSVSLRLPYCVVGGLAVVRNGAPRTTMDIDVLTIREKWSAALPIEGEISSTGPDSCVDKPSGATIDILFAGDDWQMPLPLPDPEKVAVFDKDLGANFIGLHELVQLKMAVHLAKLRVDGPGAAAKDLSDVHELMVNNLAAFSLDVFPTYAPAVRRQCRTLYKRALRSAGQRGRRSYGRR